MSRAANPNQRSISKKGMGPRDEPTTFVLLSRHVVKLLLYIFVYISPQTSTALYLSQRTFSLQ